VSVCGERSYPQEDYIHCDPPNLAIYDELTLPPHPSLRSSPLHRRFLGVLRGLCIRSRLLDRDGEVNVDSIVGLGSVSSVPKKLSKNFMLKKVQRAKRYDELSDGDKRYYDTLALIEGDPKGWIKRGMGRGFKRNMGKEGRGRGWEIRNKGMGR